MDKHMNPTENSLQTVDERNAEYLRKIDQGLADADASRVVTKTMEELAEMAPDVPSSDEAPTLRLSPSLSMEEIEANFADVDFFELLSASLEEALAHSKGDPTPGTVEHKYILPDEGLKMAERHRLGEISDSELAAWCIDWCADVALAEKVLQEYRKDPATFSVDKIIEALGLTDETEENADE